jgi:hypothetical protein
VPLVSLPFRYFCCKRMRECSDATFATLKLICIIHIRQAKFSEAVSADAIALQPRDGMVGAQLPPRWRCIGRREGHPRRCLS